MQPLSAAKLRIYQSLSDKRYRRKHGLFVAEGRKLLGEALQMQWPIEAVMVRAASKPIAPTAFSPALPLPSLPPGIPIYEVHPADFAQLSDQPQPEGVLTILRLPGATVHAPEGLPGPALLLDGITDPGNLGTLLRTAAWFGLRAVYASSGTADCWNPKVVRASMGAVLRLPVQYLPDFDQAVARHAPRIIAAALDGAALPDTGPLPGDLVLLGSESHGLRPALLDLPGLHRLRIPGGGMGVESLNVATAGSILLYRLAQGCVQ
jgi:TrmH family RNA methyltransferase